MNADLGTTEHMEKTPSQANAHSLSSDGCLCPGPEVAVPLALFYHVTGGSEHTLSGPQALH